MSHTRFGSAGRIPSTFTLSEWPLRRKVALALAIPMLLAAVLGGLRVQSELAEADNYSATVSQVTVLRPAVAYLAAAERAVVIARANTAVDSPERDAAVQAVAAAGAALERARDSAELTTGQREKVDSILDLSVQLREGNAYVSAGQSVSQIRQLHRGVTQLVNAIINAQIEPEPRLQILQPALDGRLSLALQQFQVAYAGGEQANPVELAAELGVEAAAIDRLGAALGTTHEQVRTLSQQNAAHFGTVRDGGKALGDETAYEPYDALTRDLLDGIDNDLTAAATRSRVLAVANSVVTVAALIAAIMLALFVSRLLLRPIRRVRDRALEIAQVRLPEVVARIRAGGEPGEIVPIDVDTHEEMGQLARAVDDMHRQAVTLASGEARLRSQVGEMFATLSRRNTTLINKQLGLIESLEKDEEDPRRLESLFRLDHLASRMRRTAESLMVLADAPTQVNEQDGLSVGDVLQAAIAGVQDYQRVQIVSSLTERASGAATNDVVHLMTELVDNALSYSPPTAPVLAITKTTPVGAVIQISDGGLGIAKDDQDRLNADLRSGGEVTPETARRMGLLVVSRLARRHGITVALERNDRGGTTASVTLPSAILQKRGAAGSTQGSDPVVAEPTTLERDQRVERAEPAGIAPVEPVTARPAAASQQDSIEAAINAVIRLPQRQPGASGAPGSTAPGLPAPGQGGSLFQRMSARAEAADAAAAKLAAAEPVETEPVETEPTATEPVSLEPVSLEPVSLEPVSLEPVSLEPVSLEPVSPEPVSLEPVSLEPLSLEELSAQAAVEAEALATSVAPVVPVLPEVPDEAAVAEPVVARAVHDVLDGTAPMPDWTLDETPIFKTLRSNWFSADGATGQEWASTEVEAGWEAADRAADAAPLERSEAGLPVRRPGNRLVPGGVTPAAAPVVRDPEAVRARLAAHAAGVSRGRTAAVDSEHMDRTTTEAGSA